MGQNIMACNCTTSSWGYGHASHSLKSKQFNNRMWCTSTIFSTIQHISLLSYIATTNVILYTVVLRH